MAANENRLDENSFVIGKWYMIEITYTNFGISRARTEKKLLGEYVGFHVDHRNGCSMYDEPYFLFKKDGITTRESMLDMNYYRAKVWEVDAPTPAQKVETAEAVE
jgi:hypothetical protein